MSDTENPPPTSDSSTEEPGRSARSEKSSAAFRTISEVAEELDIAQHVLRFWESKFPQVRPLKRGGGRRYYRPEDVELLRDIRSLLYQEGYTIKGAQKHLRQRRAQASAKNSATMAEAPAKSADSGPAEPTQPAETSPVLAGENRDQLERLRGELSAIRASLGEITAEIASDG